MEEYLTVKELSRKIKFSKQSLYNLIHSETFVLGKHYLKPTPKKVLFKWTEILEWMGESRDIKESIDNEHRSLKATTLSSGCSATRKPSSLINI